MSNKSVSVIQLVLWLQIRNGVGQFEAGNMSFTHAFDGFAKLHSFRFTSQRKIHFSSRFLHSSSYLFAKKHHRIQPNLMFADVAPPFGFLQKREALWNGPDNTNVNIIHFNANVLAVSDFWMVYGFDPHTLANVTRYEPLVPGIPLARQKIDPIISTAHALPEPGSATTSISFVSVISMMFGASSFNLIRVHGVTRRERICSIPVERPSYMHSFALSQHYAVLFADPVFIDIYNIIKYSTLTKSVVWEEHTPTVLYVIDLRTGRHFDVPIEPSYHLHHINSYEEHGKIVIDYVTYKNFDLFPVMLVKNMASRRKRQQIKVDPLVVRYKIDVKQRSVEIVKNPRPNALSNRLDFPTINEKYRYKPYCYIYGVTTRVGGIDLANMALVKKDTCLGKDLKWRKANHYPTEPLFAARPNATSEDDGVLMSVVFDGTSKRSYMLVLDARTFKPVAASFTPAIVPFTMHGHYFQDL